MSSNTTAAEPSLQVASSIAITSSSTPPNFLTLYSDVRCHLLNFLDWKSFVRLRATCHSYFTAPQQFTFSQRLTIKNEEKLKRSLKFSHEFMRHITHIYIPGETIKHPATFEKILHGITDSSEYVKNVAALSISEPYLSVNLECILKLTNLKELSLSGVLFSMPLPSVENMIVTALRSLHPLTSLTTAGKLPWWKECLMSVFKEGHQLQRLKMLESLHNVRIDKEVMQRLLTLPLLQGLTPKSIEEGCLPSLAHFAHLHVLELSCHHNRIGINSYIYDPTSASLLAELEEFPPALSVLTLVGWMFTETELAQVCAKLPKVTSLSLDQCRMDVPTASLSNISKCSALISLDLLLCSHITYEQLLTLSGCTTLKRLSIMQEIGDEEEEIRFAKEVQLTEEQEEEWQVPSKFIPTLEEFEYVRPIEVWSEEDEEEEEEDED